MSAQASRALVDCEVAIIGAGPVGLLLANLLGATGLRVRVLEKRLAARDHSQAIGITPPSLEILAGLGLAEAFVSRGVKLHECFVHGESGRLGSCTFRDLAGAFPYILSLPQQTNVALLEGNLGKFPTISLHRGEEVRSITQDKEGVHLEGTSSRVRARFVVACDGWRSGVREMLQIRSRSRSYDCHFLMGDFLDRSGLEKEAHLFFTADGAVESFPLPGGVRRWIVQVEASNQDHPAGHLGNLVRRRSGFELAAEDQMNETAFTPHRLDCEKLHDGRVVLCGDSAHVMSPIGGQGMNTGFGDAAQLAQVLSAILLGRGAEAPLLANYDRVRRRIAARAATRAAWGMGLGTWRGAWKSTVRDFLLREVLLTGRTGGLLARHYAMMDHATSGETEGRKG